MKQRILLALSALLLTLSSPAWAQGDPRDYVGKDALVEASTLQFEDSGERWKKLHACMSERSDDTWETYPLRKIGNFVTVDACHGERADKGACSGSWFRGHPGSQWWEVSTTHYPQSWPSVFGFSVASGNTPAGDGVGVSLWWSEGGRTVMGESLDVTFSFRGEGELMAKFSVSERLEYTIAETTIELDAEGTREELLGRLMASPESLQKEALKLHNALEAKVIEALENDQIVQCVYGPYTGRGIPPRCESKEPLDEYDRGKAIEDVKTRFAARRDVIEKHSDALQAQLLTVFPRACLGE